MIFVWWESAQDRNYIQMWITNILYSLCSQKKKYKKSSFVNILFLKNESQASSVRLKLYFYVNNLKLITSKIWNKDTFINLSNGTYFCGREEVYLEAEGVGCVG